MTNGSAIRIRDLTVGYRGHIALEGLSGTFASGSLTAIVGPNGAGKSTLLKTITGEIVPARGTVEMDQTRAASVAYLPQVADIDRRFPLTVADAVLLGLWHQIGPFRRPSKALVGRVGEALQAVGLQGLEKRQIGTLSIGQLQRMFFARLLLQSAGVILLDEPFSAVDERTIEDLLAIVRSWHEAGRTVIAVLHDIGQVRRAFPQTLLMAKRAISWGATDTVLTPDNIAMARAATNSWDHAPAALAAS